MPHAPQLFASVCSSTHEPLHGVVPLGHEKHIPAAQVACGPHTVPHAPQLFASDVVSTHPVAHGAWPLRHDAVPPWHAPEVHAVPLPGDAHLPFSHIMPSLHFVPHAPQFFSSLDKSTQEVPSHSERGAAHSWHVPATHRWPALHVVVQVPQLLPSVCGSLHTPLQQTSGALQCSLPQLRA